MDTQTNPSRILDVQNLHVTHRAEGRSVNIVDGIDFHVDKGETLGIVGESGCGKSVSMLGLVDLLPGQLSVSSGTALFDGGDLLQMADHELEQVRGGKIGFVFQDPMTSFNPVMTIGDQLVEPLRYHLGMRKKDAWMEAGRLMRLVGIPGGESRLSDYPHQLSGGMRQRVMIAMSIACQPKMLIADEPTTALDVTMQAQIVELIAELRTELGLSVIWISHDLALVSQIADRIAVLYSGKIIEEGLTAEICHSPQHPYTKGLLASMPANPSNGSRRLPSISGLPPDPAHRPQGCAFAPRCTARIEQCLTEIPDLETMPGGQRVACFVAQQHVLETAP